MKHTISKTFLLASSVLLLNACSSNGDEPDTPAATGRVAVTVIDFNPAPGQFINEIPEYKAGDTQQTILAKAQKALDKGELISLGAFGGNITLKLNRPIFHSGTGADFRVLGNAFLNTAETAARPLGASEPGIVLVMADDNGNGKPDDTWYLLSGDKFDKAVKTTVTYTDNSAQADDVKFVLWQDNHGNTGYLSRNKSFHDHAFFPLWLTDKTMSFTGYRLPDNGFFDEVSQNYRQDMYAGYADSWPNNSMKSGLSLANAIPLDANMNVTSSTVTLTRVDFIRIYTAVLQNNGPLGETSTEISGIEALHN